MFSAFKKYPLTVAIWRVESTVMFYGSVQILSILSVFVYRIHA